MTQVEAYADTVTRMSAAGSRVAIVIAPLHPAARLHGRHSLAEVLRLVPADIMVCDFSEALSESIHFEDPAHLNEAGRRAFQPVLQQAVIDMMEVRPHSSAPGAYCRPSGVVKAEMLRRP
jgi:predicted protein tyrosine phosphatase